MTPQPDYRIRAGTRVPFVLRNSARRDRVQFSEVGHTRIPLAYAPFVMSQTSVSSCGARGGRSQIRVART
jgi:hypothetical protein